MPSPILCTLTTCNHLHFVLAQMRSVVRHWRRLPEAHVLLIDGVDEPRPGFEELPWVRFLTLDDLEVDNVFWLAAKLTASDFCCALKPYLVGHLLARYQVPVLYADADQCFFADPAPLLDCAPDASLVVTPHVLSPLPAERPFDRPSLGDLAAAGMMNAGIFLMRPGPSMTSFIAQWSRLVSAPGAFLAALGTQHEQNAFNWSLAFADGVAVCRDPRLNVAYWNLHERPLRWAALDGGPSDCWLLDGKPPVSIYFSGFDWERGRLSRHDHRSQPALNLNLQALGDYYAAELASAEQAHYQSLPYAFAACGSLSLTADLRTELKWAEQFSIPAWTAWPSASQLVAPLLAAPSDHVNLPLFLARIHDARADLQALNYNDVLYPSIFMSWCQEHLRAEYAATGAALEAADVWAVERRGSRRLAACGTALALRRIRPTRIFSNASRGCWTRIAPPSRPRARGP